ncbi:tetratricopeptide repeat-containing protein [Cryptosporidium felis]|nr:tetratricopeptide repeat-containing protein [Cryptosporidium felis]
MQTTLDEYNYCKKLMQNYEKYQDILKANKSCSHDRSKERELYERPTSDKLSAIRLFCEGNKQYRNNKFEEAILEYRNALIYIDYTFPESNTIEDEEYNNLILRVNLNLSACFLKVNALFRLSQAYKGIYKYDEALEIIEDVLKSSNSTDFDNNDKQAFLKLRNDITLTENKYKVSNSTFYKKLFK